ncbi:ARM repeat-containing protein [Rhizodiscina lignyota]|uniref:ARM repeat-containing protein n=1 Tax=Rhizodiscina lignyota TaxID=1504668 RepID=A0A9P4IBF9_9PEZI|nr:ARM repeat-containing protein [Rhizodiscina lignyota]
MARAPPPAALADLRAASSIQSQIVALRRLKNDLIGHDQRKEACIKHGAVNLLVELLNGALRAGGKRRRVDVNGGKNATGRERRSSVDERWSHEDELRLQCTIVVGSLAQGGLAYVTPLLAGGIVQPLLSALSPRETPATLVVATLRTLLACADAVSMDIQFLDPVTTTLADQVFSKPDVGALSEILAQTSTTDIVQEQQVLVYQLIACACQGLDHPNALLRAGALDLMAAQLAASIMADGYPGLGTDSKNLTDLPPPPPKSHVSHILRAISALTTTDYRCARFVYNPSISSIFPASKLQSSTSSTAVYGQLFNSSLQGSGPETLDRLLPQLSTAFGKPETSFSKAFPALGSFASSSEYSRAASLFAESAAAKSSSPTRTTTQEFGTQLVTWLLYKARTETGLDRLSAVWQLTLIIKAKDKIFPDSPPGESGPSRNRDRILTYLLVPLIVRMIEEANNETKNNPIVEPQFRHLSPLRIKELAMSALAQLVEDSKGLQQAAVDAGAIKLLCQILKRTFDPIPDRRGKMWTPYSTDTNMEMDEETDQSKSTQLGSRGLSPEVVHALRCRAAAMEALAQIGQVDDNIRKTIIESGIIACVVDSLTAYQETPVGTVAESLSNADALDGKKGNPIVVIVAACNLARALSRSVNILRTSLIDGGLAKPIYLLLKHPNMSVKHGAVNVLCNLLLSFSPMRDELIQGGCIKILCEHAHSADNDLQMMSLWALKHLVYQASPDTKISCLDELGAGWLIQTLTGEMRDPFSSFTRATASQGSTPIGMGTPNAAGEQVDLLNAADDPTMDVDASSTSGEDEPEDDAMADSITSLNLPRYLPNPPAVQRPTNLQHRARLKLIKRDEQNAAVMAWKHEVRIQEQALDFLRNLISDPQSEQDKMIDHVLATLDAQRLFDILLSKLRPSSPQPAPQRDQPRQPHGKHPALTTPGSAARFAASATYSPAYSTHRHPPPSTASILSQITTPPDLLVSTIFLIVHIANGRASQRQQLLSQTPLMSATLPLFSHPDRRIRTALCWLAHNLVWLDSNSTDDQISARQRARELRNLGVEEKVRLALGDEHRDVVERARGVVDSIEKLLGPEDGHAGGQRSPRDDRGLLAGRVGVGLGGPGARAWER